jgi:hypothetical protein
MVIPEVDRGEWFSLDRARVFLRIEQAPLLDALTHQLFGVIVSLAVSNMDLSGCHKSGWRPVCRGITPFFVGLFAHAEIQLTAGEDISMGKP